jgi:hypothetical protein
MNSQEMIVDLKSKLDELSAQVEQEKTDKYNEGFAAGVASMNNGSDKIYSQAELDAQLQPLKDQVAAMQSQIDSLQASVDALPGQIDAAKLAGKEEGKVELKAELKAAYEAQQVAESQGETGFGSLLG